MRALVPRLVPSGTSGVVLHMGTAMGLLPLVSLSAGANLVYAVEPHAFVAKLARAQAQRHALVEFENTHWERLPLSLGLAEKRLRDAGGAAFRAASTSARSRCTPRRCRRPRRSLPTTGRSAPASSATAPSAT